MPQTYHQERHMAPGKMQIILSQASQKCYVFVPRFPCQSIP